MAQTFFIGNAKQGLTRPPLQLPLTAIPRQIDCSFCIAIHAVFVGILFHKQGNLGRSEIHPLLNNSELVITESEIIHNQ